MTSVETISAIWCEVLLNEQISRFDRVLSEGNPERMLPEFSGAARVFQGLQREQQVALLQFFRVVAVDTASRLLGNLDGSSSTAGIEKTFVVTYGGEDIAGRLQDGFLAAVEESGYLGGG